MWKNVQRLALRPGVGSSDPKQETSYIDVGRRYSLLLRESVSSACARGKGLRPYLNTRFDGDTGSGTIGYSEDTKMEIRDLLHSRRYYVGTNGKINFTIDTDTVKYLLHNLTGKAE